MAIISQSLFTFLPSTKSIQFVVPGFEVSKLKSIINITKDIVIYSPGQEGGSLIPLTMLRRRPWC